MTPPVVTHRASKRLDLSILLRVSWLDISQRNSLLTHPTLDLFSDVLRGVTTTDFHRPTTPRAHQLQRPFGP